MVGSFSLALDAAGSAECAVALAGTALAVSAADLHPPIPVTGGWQLPGNSETAETLIKLQFEKSLNIYCLLYWI